ncbi:MAG: YigZ family protein [Clostridia bacterium]|nr:YigZ family protein [Clostridia bacterium]
MDNKRTVLQNSVYEIEVKHSRFIGCAFPVKSVDEANAIIASIRAEHRKARHNVYAYIIGSNTGYSDDGEPKKTAGLPIYDYLRKEELTDVLVVVTRYFGGILLGTGGLVKAYTDAAKGAVEAAVPAKVERCELYKFETDYGTAERLRAQITDYTVDVEVEYTDKISITVTVLKEYGKKLIKEATEILKTNEYEYLGERDITVKQ